MKKQIFAVVGIISIILMASMVFALEEERQNRIDFGYVLLIQDIRTDPATITPGNPVDLVITLQNNANFMLYDIRADLTLPSGFTYNNDVSKVKIFRMEAGDVTKIVYSLIASPTVTEGVYQGNLTVEYLNHVATERTETYEYGLTVRNKPELYVQVEESDISSGKNPGDVTIRFVNNDLADIKFLTVELEDTEDYTVLTPKKQYIGDLDSDDFESVDYTLDVRGKETVPLRLKMSYKDTFNKDYEDTVTVDLNTLNTEELGANQNNTLIIVLVVIAVVVILFVVYRVMKKKRKKNKKY